MHLTAKGYEIIYAELTKVIAASYPDLVPEHIPIRIPLYGTLQNDFTNAIKSIESSAKSV
jgi:hypothetical protein